jgi:hypothetical protein
MDSLFPQALYAEDQPNAKAILYMHVMRASAMSFTFFSLARIPITLVRSRFRRVPVDMSTLFTRTLQSSGRAFVLGSAAGAATTWGRMRGKTEIEWQDRSWRILGNRGEVQTDWATVGGMGAAAVAGAVAARRGVIPTSVGKAGLGGAASGSSVGKSAVLDVVFMMNADFEILGIPCMIVTFMMGRKPA